MSILNDTLNNLLVLNDNIINEHLMNKISLTSSYLKFFVSIFKNSLCTLPELSNLKNCTNLLGGSAVNVRLNT